MKYVISTTGMLVAVCKVLEKDREKNMKFELQFIDSWIIIGLLLFVAY